MHCLSPVYFVNQFLPNPANRQSTRKHKSTNFCIYTGCFRRNSKYFRRWYYGLFRVNKFIQTCVQFSVGVTIQLFEVGAYRLDFYLWGWMKIEV